MVDAVWRSATSRDLVNVSMKPGHDAPTKNKNQQRGRYYPLEICLNRHLRLDWSLGYRISTPSRNNAHRPQNKHTQKDVRTQKPRRDKTDKHERTRTPHCSSAPFPEASSSSEPSPWGSAARPRRPLSLPRWRPRLPLCSGKPRRAFPRACPSPERRRRGWDRVRSSRGWKSPATPGGNV